MMHAASGDTQNPNIDQHRDALELIRRVRDISLRKQLWPGFDPLDIPLAVYDGVQTFLFGCEKAPAGFHQIKGAEFDYLIFGGRHPSIVANTCIPIEDILVATLMTDHDSLKWDADHLASIAIHEMFHVFQFQNRQKWAPANEADRFLYPLNDAGLLKLRRIEVAALHRAVKSEQIADKIGWANYVIQTRRERFALMAAPFLKYERNTEIMEGLATYIEANSIDRQGVDLPPDGYSPDQLRSSCYKIGHAFALLLDETSPDWKLRFERETPRSLDEYLSDALLAFQGHDAHKEFSHAELEHFKNLAAQDLIQMANERSNREHDFRNRPGQRIIVEADDTVPFQVSGFDPLNVFLLDDGVIHSRLLHLESGEHTIRMLREDTDVAALTESVGSHPLFSGIGRVEFVVQGDVSCTDDCGVVTISGGGLEAQLGGVLRLENGDMVIRLR